MLTDAKRPDSLACTLAEVFRIGGNVRERLSGDMMFLIGRLRDSIQIGQRTPFLEYPALLTDCLGAAFRIFRNGARKHQPRVRLDFHDHGPAP